ELDDAARDQVEELLDAHELVAQLEGDRQGDVLQRLHGELLLLGPFVFRGHSLIIRYRGRRAPSRSPPWCGAGNAPSPRLPGPFRPKPSQPRGFWRSARGGRP